MPIQNWPYRPMCLAPLTSPPPAKRLSILSLRARLAVYRPDLAAHDEQHSVIEPVDLYGWTKLQGEHYVRYFAKLRQFSACIVRLFNVVGRAKQSHVLPEIIAQLKANRVPLRLGNIEPKRDYIHVKDVASGFAAVLCMVAWLQARQSPSTWEPNMPSAFASSSRNCRTSLERLLTLHAIQLGCAPRIGLI